MIFPYSKELLCLIRIHSLFLLSVIRDVRRIDKEFELKLVFKHRVGWIDHMEKSSIIKNSIILKNLGTGIIIILGNII